jgi:hypothetical protein
MSERLVTFLDEVLQRYFGPEFGSSARMRHGDLEKLLTDDAERRLAHVRLAAVEWGTTEIRGNVEIRAEHWVITPRGLLYAAELATSADRSLYYLATPRALFEPVVEQTGAVHLPPESAAAVDSRLDPDLVFPWPLDAALRRKLDAHEVLRLDLIEH